MCKIMIMAGISDKTRENALKFIEQMAKEMSPYNQDGLGYAALDKDGNLFGERWLSNDDAFKLRPTDLDEKIQKDFQEVIYKTVYNKFGTLNLDNISAITLHTRMATSSKEFRNTHPFVENDTSLIHNGIINDIKPEDLKQSSCDSEKILNDYLINNISDNPEDISKMTEKLKGYYVCGMFSKTSGGQNVLDIFKSSTGRLDVVFVKELNTLVFSTTADDILSACKVLGFDVISVYKVKPSSFMRINPFTNAPIYSTKFKEKEYGWSNYGKDYYRNNR